MEEFITQAAARFGISADKVRALTGGLLKKAKDHGGDDFDALAGQVPGVEQAAAQADDDDAPAGGGGGLFGGLGGGLLSKAASAVGAGGAVDVMGLFQKAGLDPSKASGFVASLVGFLKEKAPAGLVDGLLAKVPGLKNLVG